MRSISRICFRKRFRRRRGTHFREITRIAEYYCLANEMGWNERCTSAGGTRQVTMVGPQNDGEVASGSRAPSGQPILCLLSWHTPLMWPIEFYWAMRFGFYHTIPEHGGLYSITTARHKASTGKDSSKGAARPPFKMRSFFFWVLQRLRENWTNPKPFPFSSPRQLPSRKKKKKKNTSSISSFLILLLEVVLVPVLETRCSALPPWLPPPNMSISSPSRRPSP